MVGAHALMERPLVSLDPDGWASVMSGKAIAENLVWEWNTIKYR